MCNIWGIGERVMFMGHVEHTEMPQYYAGADVFVLPSLVETQGMVAIEAMFFAKPVIVTDRIISATELVDDGVNGFVVDHTSVQELAKKLTLLSDDAELRNRMGEASKHAPSDLARRKSSTIWRIST